MQKYKLSNHMKSEIISQFIRFNASGAVERVTWHKNTTGEKTVSVSPYAPNSFELFALSNSNNTEASIRINQLLPI